MVKKGRDRHGGSSPKYRRKLPCVNHPMTVAVAKCEVCGNPICKQCILYYEGAEICGGRCWTKKALDIPERISAAERRRRRRREIKANRIVTAGLWIVFILVLGGVGTLIHMKLTGRAGEKVWELTDSAGSLEFCVRPDLNSVFLFSTEGNVEVVDALTSKPKWSVKLPEDVTRRKFVVVDENRCLAYCSNKVCLCSSGKTVPEWTFTAPCSSVCAEPVFLDNRLYIASSSAGSYAEMFSSIEMLTSTSLSFGKHSSIMDDQARAKKCSTISAVDIVSGAELWQSELDNVRAAGLLADRNRVYVAGNLIRRHAEYDNHGAQKENEEDKAEDTEKEAQLSSIQLWALDASTGKPEWKAEGTGTLLGPPVMSDEDIVLSTQDNIYLVSPKGEIRWTYPLFGQRVTSAQPHDGNLFVSTNDGFLSCIDLASGQRKWMAKIGAGADKIVVRPPLTYVSGLIRIDEAPPAVTVTKRWEGSEDLLEKALRASSAHYEKVLCGIDIESGEKRWTIPKIRGDFEYGEGLIYALRYVEWMQFYDASADPSDISKIVSNLGAYNSMTGEKIWESAIDGYASDLRLSRGVAIVTARPAVFSLAAGGGKRPARLVGISLE